jgi:quinone-modifying oxidoreductase subunit QmoC
MTERIAINADLSIVQSLLKNGAADLKFCYQCATCTVVCPVTPDGAPFPRKEMVYAQWGLKDKLLRSLDSWLCIHCNDCSTHCPRGAKPGDVMAAIRSMSVQAFAVPGFIAKAAATPSLIWTLFLIPALLLAVVIFGLHGASFDFLDGRIVYAKMLPVPAIDAIFISACTFAGVAATLGLLRFLKAMKEEYPRTEQGQPMPQAVIGTAKAILSHSLFRDCGTNKHRYSAHLLTMYGFLGLFVTTSLVGMIYYLNLFGVDVQVTPFDFFHPVKLLGNVSGTLALLGCTVAMARRMTRVDVGTSSVFDWVFLWNLFLTVFTGFLCQIFRVFDWAALAYLTYYVHLIFVFFLLAYAPYTKFAHIFYRTAAMIFSRYSGRQDAAPVRVL